MNSIEIDLYSDTVTKPTPGMREAIYSAEVGDEQQRQDPTVNRLVGMVCDLLNKEDAIFLPSGTMCNQISFRVHCDPGDEIIMDCTAHTRHYETGGPAALTGASIYPIEGKRGIFSSRQLEEAIRPHDNHFPRSRVVLIEQTSNLAGGTVWPLSVIEEVCDLAHSKGLVCHMDGARLLNAVVSSGISADKYASFFESIWIDFSKGLGAPMGAVLAGSRDFIKKAWRWKHQFGGAMRQAGIVAAGAVYALENNIERLAEDHDNAEALAKGLSGTKGIRLLPSETNMVYFDVSGLGLNSAEFNSLMIKYGVRFSSIGEYTLRAVTHLEITAEKIKQALILIEEAVKNIRV